MTNRVNVGQQAVGGDEFVVVAGPCSLESYEQFHTISQAVTEAGACMLRGGMFKLRTDPDSQAGHEFTSQWFFDESLTDVVHAQEPYASKGYRTLKNEGDGIYQQAGEQMILNVVPEGDGYTATFDVSMQMA